MSKTIADEKVPDELPLVFIIIGEIRKRGETGMIPFNAVLRSSDDDSAVHECLKALAQEGYEEADLHHIGNIDGAPPDEPLASAYQAAMEGEFALIAYEGGYELGEPDLDKPIILPPEG